MNTKTILLLVCMYGCTPQDVDAGFKTECFDRVRGLLKSPASATFDEPRLSKRGGDVKVAGTVHSQNSFGAMLPTTYECVVIFLADNYFTVALTMDGTEIYSTAPKF